MQKGIVDTKVVKFQKGKLLKKFTGTDNYNNSCYFNIAIRFLLCHPFFYERLENIQKIGKETDVGKFIAENYGDFFTKLYQLSITGKEETFREIYDYYTTKERLGSEEDGPGSMQDPRQDIMTIADWMNSIFHKQNDFFDICSSVTYSCVYNGIYCSDEDSLEDFELIQQKEPKIISDVFSAYNCSKKGDKQQKATATDANQNYTITIENKKYNDVVMFQKFGSEDNKLQAEIKTKSGLIKKNINTISTEDISSICIGDDEHVLLCAGLHKNKHWQMYCECNGEKIIFNNQYQVKTKNKVFGNPLHGLGPLMFIKNKSLKKGKANFLNTKVESKDSVKEMVALTREEKKSLLDNIRKLETEKIICFRKIIKKMIEKNVIEDNDILSEFFTKSNADPIITFSKTFDANADEIFSPNDRSKLSAAYELIRSYFENNGKQDLNSCTGLIYSQQLSYNDNDYVNKDIEEIRENTNKIMNYLNSLESKKAENKRDDVIKNNVVKNDDVKNDDVTPQQPAVNQPFQSNIQSNNVERNNSNKPYTRQITPAYKYKTPINYKKPLKKEDEKKKYIDKEIEEENKDIDAKIEQEELNMKKFGKRPVIEFWVYLLCLVLIGFYILYLKKEEIEEWDRKQASYNNKIKELQRTKSRNIDYNLKNFDTKERMI